ncbi:C-GCAxxG-C-C family (seleno)protein [Allobaculum mucilyticum]|uniref:C-GCAxxG-C-C family (seleno)protein n=1 Tax=Allobaculum mucilyticum TaxID=2834459 RepID=UPI001E2A1CBF|nr:C-GCAxxG-C-C family (seleno)protein [Allobaculum mucilyticum]UNT96475.1 C-GCAxxG-C-C family protein [Allobaculum mucilyticum]
MNAISEQTVSPLEETVHRLYATQNTNCAETLLAACNEVYDLDLPESSIRLMSGFGSGLYTGNVCGALCGLTAALSMLLVEDRAHTCKPLRPSQVLLVRNFRQILGETQCAKCKALHHSETERCLKTCLLAAQAMNQTVSELEEQGVLVLPASCKAKAESQNEPAK